MTRHGELNRREELIIPRCNADGFCLAKSRARRAFDTSTPLIKSLLTTSSVIALIAVGSNPALAQCAVGTTSGYDNPFGTTIACILFNTVNVNGNAVNAGTVTGSGSGIQIFGGSFNGAVINSGSISVGGDGIAIFDVSTVTGGISNSGTITSTTFAGIFVSNISGFSGGIANTGSISVVGCASAVAVQSISTFTGGITNGGTISGHSVTALVVKAVSTFTGGITNSGMISADTADAISVSQVLTFAGGITNSGTILAPVGKTGISVDAVTAFSGGISNGGMISAGSSGILVKVVSAFSGGITNSGTISAATGIDVLVVSTFSGGISNSGTISAAGTGITVFSVSTFSNGIANSGTIAAGANGIAVDNFSTFAGGISNSGTIAAGGNGIVVGGSADGSGSTVTLSTFAGGISNSGLISVSGGKNRASGIFVGGTALNSGASVTISAFTGGISNSGIISLSGGKNGSAGIVVGGRASGTAASVTISTFTGGISNSGIISVSGGGNGSAGIVVGGRASGTAATVTISTFGGGISNSGTIAASGGANRSDGIVVGNIGSGTSVTIATFAGNISNIGVIAATGIGVAVNAVGSFAGNISNSGTISGGISGIEVTHVSVFTGGITNSGTISSGSATGIRVDTVTAFSGGITNSGAIVAQSSQGIVVTAVSSFSGGISNSGTITAVSGKGVVVSGVSTFVGGITNTGTISGNTGIQVTGGVTFAGAIANSGNITGSGGTAIDVSNAPNAMTINQTAGTISGAIKLSPFADNLNISGGVINGNIVGSGSTDTVTFALGNGTFTYANPYGFTAVNQVNINSGTVILNGPNDATSVDVNGGTLGGTGSIDPLTMTIHNGAVFAPGTPGTPGTSMSITGTLAFQSGALYRIYLNPATASFADVTGTASLAGTVNAVFATGSYVQRQYTILTTTGGLGGTTFAGVTGTNSPSGLGETLTYSADDVFLNLVPGFTTYSGLNANQQSVANALANYFNNNGGIPAAFLGLSAGQLTQIDGEAATGAARGAFQLMNEFLDLMLDPFVNGRDGTGWPGGGSQANGFAPEQRTNFPPDVALAYASVLKPSPKPATLDQRWSTWASAFGGSNTTNGDAAAGTNNITASAYGFAGGMDYHFSPDTVVGFALAGGGTNWNLAQGLGGGRSDAFQAGIYGATRSGPAYVAATLAFANHWMTTDRFAVGDQLTANFNAQSYAARVEAGYRYAVVSTIGVTPYAALQAQDFHTPSYSETDLTGGGFGLSYGAMTATDTRSELGARFDDPTLLAGVPLVLHGRLAWAHDWVSNPTLGAVFETLPGASFTVGGAAPPPNTALASAGADLHFATNWSLMAKFDGEFGSGSQTYAGTGTLRYTW